MLPPPLQKVIYYRKLGEIDYDKVNSDLASMNVSLSVLQQTNVDDAFYVLQSTLIQLIDKYAPKKKKVIKAKDFPFMSKRLRKAILICNQHRNKFFKLRTSFNLALYRNHRNMVTLIKKEEIRKYFQEKCQNGTTNKDFWKAVKPMFSRTKTKPDTIPLREGDKIITDSSKVCNIFNDFFREIGANIG